MSNDATYGRPSSEDEILRLGEVEAESFGLAPAAVTPWFAYAGHENLRVWRDGQDLVAGFVFVPMAQYWGGRSVKLCGFAGVAVQPHVRGRGVATRLMGAGLRELREAGWPLAGLYPATQPVYRRVGFEQTGVRFEARGPITALPVYSRELPVRPLRQEDLPAIKALYAEHARGRNGHLDRGPYVWHRVQFPRQHTVYGYVLGAPGVVDGYVFLARVLKPNINIDVLVVDMAAKTPEGWRRLLTFVRDHDSLTDDVVWFGGADDPRLHLVEEQRIALRSYDAPNWMTRILDVKAAFEARGYPSFARGALHLEVTDSLFAENAGRYVLEVSGGEARVTRGGEGALRCDVNALACVFSGFRRASELAAVGVVSGTRQALETADALFGGPMPSMPDMY